MLKLRRLFIQLLRFFIGQRCPNCAAQKRQGCIFGAGEPPRSTDRDVSWKRISVDRIPVICYDFSENRPAASGGGLQPVKKHEQKNEQGEQIMIITTTENILGKQAEILGLVKGSTIQTVNAFRDIGAGLKTLIGGELTKYNDMMDKARSIATQRMIDEAEALGADAIICTRFATSSIMQSAAEIMVYGTAVKLR